MTKAMSGGAFSHRPYQRTGTDPCAQRPVFAARLDQIFS